ncbi:MAG TPA: hypothetical protein VII71_03675, partial [Verrucomicrobiae bacterium]
MRLSRLAAAFALAGILAFATVVASFAIALPFATVLTFAIMFAHIAAGGVRARCIGAVLRVSFRDDTRQQPGDGRSNEKSPLSSGHILSYLFFLFDGLSFGIHGAKQFAPAKIQSAL